MPPPKKYFRHESKLGDQISFYFYFDYMQIKLKISIKWH